MTQEQYFRKLLPNGNNVDISTKPGAKAFMEQMGSSFIRKNFPEAGRDRSRFAALRGQRKAAAVKALINWYTIIACLAKTAEPSDFQANIPENELRCFILHAKDVFLDLKVNSKWIQSGNMGKCDQEMFVAMIPLGKHRVFNELMEKEKMFDTLADVFMALPKNKVPSPPVADSLISVANIYHLCMQTEANMDKETIFSRLESSGVLGQTFRCFLAKPPHPQAIAGYLHMLANLQECTGLIRNRLKSEKPTGGIMDDILKRHSHKLHPMVKTRLENFQKVAKAANNTSTPDGIKEHVMCRLCGKSQWDLGDGRKPLMRCGRCKAASYCSRECQISDWRVHKLFCKKISNVGLHDQCTEEEKQVVEASVRSFLQEHWHKLLRQLHDMCTEHNVGTEKLILELDFRGTAPASRGEFKVGLADRYLNDDRPDEPDWFYKGTYVYEDNVTRWLALVKDESKNITDNNIMCIFRNPTGLYFALPLNFFDQETGQDIVLTEAVNAVGKGDVSATKRIIGTSSTRHVAGPPPGDLADRLLQTLMAFVFDLLDRIRSAF